MKKTRKVLLALLSVLTAASLSLGIASCDLIQPNSSVTESSSSQTEDSEFRQVYATYVAYAKEQGSTPLSYEEWLKNIRGEKGDKGDKGDNGKDGINGQDGKDGLTPYIGENGNWWIGSVDTGVKAAGEKGEDGKDGTDGKDGVDGKDGADGIDGQDGKDGVGIENVKFDKDGNLVIIFTDGTKQTIEMPKEETHVHTFGEWTVFTDEDTSCENRLFFRVCSGCNSVEWKQGSYADHNWEIVTTSPTCQAKGYDTKTCKVCGKVEIGNYTNKIDHDWKTEYAYDNSYHWHECSMCDNIKDKAEHTPDESGECSVCGELIGATEGVLYDVSADGTYAEVIGYEGTSTKVIIANTYNGLPVKTICENAFYQNTTITSVIIPDCVTFIGAFVFYDCDSLMSVVIGDGVISIGMGAFYDCDSLTSVIIPDSVTSIDIGLFCECSNLTSVTIGDSVTSIGEAMFYRCYSLTSITIGNSVTSIGESAFQSCSSLTSVTLPDSVTSIGDYVFMGCTGLTSVTIGDGVTSIGVGAFSICSNLTSVTMGDSITSIGTGAFEYCRHLTSITIPASVASIGYGAFQACIKLVEIINKSSLDITKGSSDIDMGYYALYIHNGDVSKIENQDGYQFITDENGINYLLGYTGTETNLILPNSYNDEEYQIYKYAFRDRSDLTSVIIGNNVTAIGTYAFGYCNNLTSVTIPDSVTSIGTFAFWDCSSLTSVTIPNSVTSIGENVFFNCTGLTSIYYKGTESEWDTISISGENGHMTNVTRYYYSETEPTESGNYWHYVNGIVTPWVFTKEE